MASSGYQPKGPAPIAGGYRDLNAIGARTGKMALMSEGDRPPPDPGRSTQPLSQRSSAELRAEAARYRRMAAETTTTSVRESFERIADRLEALAARREREERG
jgi:hypothetical protein